MTLFGMALVLAIILLGTWRLARRAAQSRKAASVASIIWINGCLVMVGVILIGGSWYGVRAWQYGRCVDSVDARQAFRATANGIYDTIDAATDTTYYTSELQATKLDRGPRAGEIVTLREALEINQPPLARSACHRP